MRDPCGECCRSPSPGPGVCHIALLRSPGALRSLHAPGGNDAPERSSGLRVMRNEKGPCGMFVDGQMEAIGNRKKGLYSKIPVTLPSLISGRLRPAPPKSTRNPESATNSIRGCFQSVHANGQWRDVHQRCVTHCAVAGATTVATVHSLPSCTILLVHLFPSRNVITANVPAPHFGAATLPVHGRPQGAMTNRRSRVARTGRAGGGVRTAA